MINAFPSRREITADLYKENKEILEILGSFPLDDFLYFIKCGVRISIKSKTGNQNND